MDYRIISSTEEFANLKDDWERLEKLSPQITVFSTFQYNYQWWESINHFDKYRLWIISVIHNNTIVGIAPLVIESLKIYQVFTINVLRFLSPGDYQEILVDHTINVSQDNIYKIIFQAIEEHGAVWDKIHLTHIPHRSPFANYSFKSPLNKHFTPLIEAPYIDLSKYADIEEFEKKCVPNKAKQYARRLKSRVDYLFTHNTVSLDECIYLHKQEQEYLNIRGLTHRYSIFDNQQIKSFTKSLDEAGKLEKFALIQAGTGQIIIYNWGLIKDGVFYSVNTAFDPIFENFAVGRVMYYELLRYAYQTKIFNVLDAGTGRYAWKFEWTNDFNLLYQLAFNKPRSKWLRQAYKIKFNIARILGCN